MAQIGFKTSKQNKDVFKVGVFEQTANSENTLLEIVKEGELRRTGDVTERIPHGLDFIPGFLGFFEINGNGSWYPIYSTVEQPNTFNYVNMYSDSTYINIEFGFDTATSISVKYFLLNNPAA